MTAGTITTAADVGPVVRQERDLLEHKFAVGHVTPQREPADDEDAGWALHEDQLAQGGV